MLYAASKAKAQTVIETSSTTAPATTTTTTVMATAMATAMATTRATTIQPGAHCVHYFYIKRRKRQYHCNNIKITVKTTVEILC